MTRLLLLAATAVLLLSGCTGLPAGAADLGDTVTVRYAIHDLDGNVLRPERTATFVVGTGGSGLGLGFERGVRGHLVNENTTLTVRDDPSLAFGKTVEVDRQLQGIDQVQDAPRRDFEANVGPATVGQTFPAFGIYTATVTGFTADRVNFTIEAKPDQHDPVPSVGAVLVSQGDGTTIHRSLDPTVGATFVINPPTSTNPNTPLGLAPGTYKTLGATETKLQYSYSSSGSLDLVGKDLRFTFTITSIRPGSHDVEPVGGNYVARPSPYVNGDPEAVLGAKPADGEAADGHTH